MSDKLIPQQKVNSALRRIAQWGTPQDRDELSAAFATASSAAMAGFRREGQLVFRKKVLEIAARVPRHG